VTESNIETNRNPGHNHFRSQIKFKQYICCNMNRTDNTVKQNNVNRLVGYNSYDSYLFAIWLCINRNILNGIRIGQKDMEYKIITVNHYCQPYRIEYNQFRIETLTVFEIEIPETAYV
jgi:hypothetical protein